MLQCAQPKCFQNKRLMSCFMFSVTFAVTDVCGIYFIKIDVLAMPANNAAICAAEVL